MPVCCHLHCRCHPPPLPPPQWHQSGLWSETTHSFCLFWGHILCWFRSFEILTGAKPSCGLQTGAANPQETSKLSFFLVHFGGIPEGAQGLLFSSTLRYCSWQARLWGPYGMPGIQARYVPGLPQTRQTTYHCAIALALPPSFPREYLGGESGPRFPQVLVGPHHPLWDAEEFGATLEGLSHGRVRGSGVNLDGPILLVPGPTGDSGSCPSALIPFTLFGILRGPWAGVGE